MSPHSCTLTVTDVICWFGTKSLHSYFIYLMILCYFILRYVMSYFMLFYVIFYVISFYVVLCHILCCFMSYFMLFYVIFYVISLLSELGRIFCLTVTKVNICPTKLTSYPLRTLLQLMTSLIAGRILIIFLLYYIMNYKKFVNNLASNCRKVTSKTFWKRRLVTKRVPIYLVIAHSP